ncbi:MULTISPECIES: hypothetical protein [Sphingobacterium]|uniref:hypothetical protein n=1 Tax=Sphingobacterium TaxID=28453 RepID=UPI0013DA9B11|nr:MULTISPECIES: hypothetical protein [unclassified Sphingobacterium]
MMENRGDINIHIEKFVKNITPQPIEPKESNGDKMIKWGIDNLYPNFLIEISKKSALHGAILQTKSNYIFSDGVINKESGEIIGDDIQVNEDDNLSELVKKCINDAVVFGGFAVKVEFNALGEPLYYYHVPFHHVRANKSKSKFFVNDDWFNFPRTYFTYEKYNVFKNEDFQPKIFYFNSYNISVNNVYVEPDYNCIEDVVTDMLISKLFKNSIANGFSVGKVITVLGAIPDEQTKNRATAKFKDVFNGVDGENFMLQWATNKDQKTEIDTIPADDYASKVVEIVKKTERNILSAHSATSSQLFGIEKEGSLGNATELENAYLLFKNNYVKDKRIEIVSAFNKLFKSDERLPKIDLKDKEVLFKKTLESSTKEKVFTINELRAIEGAEPIEGGDVFITSNSNTFTISPTNAPANSTFSKKKDDDEVEGYFATPEDFEKVKHLGNNKDEFILIGESKFSSCGEYHFASTYSSIEEYLLDNKINELTIDEASAKISNELGYSVSKSDVQTSIDLLKNAGLIDVKINTQNNKMWTAPSLINNANKIEIYYDYVKRPEADGAIKIPTTRHFCESIIDSDKYFSMADIQSFSAVLGYDVMKFGGGYWKNKNTGEVNRHCRHEFKPVRVYKK